MMSDRVIKESYIKCQLCSKGMEIADTDQVTCKTTAYLIYGQLMTVNEQMNTFVDRRERSGKKGKSVSFNKKK